MVAVFIPSEKHDCFGGRFLCQFLQSEPKAGRPQGVDLFGKYVPHNGNGDKRERRNGGKRQSVYVLVLLGRRRGEYERGLVFVLAL